MFGIDLSSILGNGIVNLLFPGMSGSLLGSGNSASQSSLPMSVMIIGAIVVVVIVIALLFLLG